MGTTYSTKGNGLMEIWTGLSYYVGTIITIRERQVLRDRKGKNLKGHEPVKAIVKGIFMTGPKKEKDNMQLLLRVAGEDRLCLLSCLDIDKNVCDDSVQADSLDIEILSNEIDSAVDELFDDIELTTADGEEDF